MARCRVKRLNSTTILYLATDTGRRDSFSVDLTQSEAVTAPSVKFRLSKPSTRELEAIIRKARSSSAPGPNGVPYKVYKNCPLTSQLLIALLKKVWSTGCVPQDWQVAEGCLIPKISNSKAIGDFRHISLLNVEGKLFFAALARRLQDYLFRNGYINQRIQKGATRGCPGVLEHVASLFTMVSDARKDKKTLHVVFCDIANAFGSVPHRVNLRGASTLSCPPEGLLSA